MLVLLLILAVLSGTAATTVNVPPVFTTLEDIPLDESGNVLDQWILYPDGECALSVESNWASAEPAMRKNARVGGALVDQLFDNTRSNQAKSLGSCPALCLSKGTPFNLIPSPADYLVYSGKRDSIKFDRYLR